MAFTLLALAIPFREVFASDRERALVGAINELRSLRTAADESVLGDLLNQYTDASDPKDRRIVALALGDRLIATSPRAALQYFTQADTLAAGNTALSTVTGYHRARALLSVGSFDQSEQVARRVLDNEPPAAWARLTWEVLLDALAAQRRNPDLLAEYVKYSAKFPPGRRQQDIVRVAAVALGEKGNDAAVVSALEELVTTWPMGDNARWAFRALIDRSCALRPFARRYFFSRELLFRIARNTVLESGVKEFVLGQLEMPIVHEDGSTRRSTPVERVDFLLRARLYDEAIPAALEITERPPSNQEEHLDRARGFLLLGRAYAARGQHETAIRHYATFLEEYPLMREVFRARELMADSLSRLGLYRESAALYAIVASHPNADDTVRWHHFWNVWRSGDMDSAMELLNRPGYVPPRDRTDKSGLTYWRARVLDRMGERDAADAHYRKVLQVDASSFYGVMALARVGSEFSASEEESLASSDPIVGEDEPETVANADSTSVEETFAETEKSAKSEESEFFRARAMSARLIERPITVSARDLPDEIQLVDDLRRVKMFEAARMQMRSLSWQRYPDQGTQEVLGELALQVNDYLPLMRTAWRPGSALRSRPRNLESIVEHKNSHRAEWQRYFPRAFDDVVTKMSSAAEVSPYFVWSIMRAESHYNVDAKSPVGALGLMQIMPYTAARIALLLGDDSFEIASLKDPEQSVGYGAWYLRWLQNYYGDSLVPTIAAYNAGPVMVNKWIDSCRGCELDEFTEFIPFRETRRYVKSVLRNMDSYLHVHENQSVVPLLQPLPANVPEGHEIF